MIKIIGVIGAGQMGAGIAKTFLQNNYSVILFDEFPQALENAKKRLSLTSHTQLINITDDFDCLKKCDVIIEAIPEDFSMKVGLFKRLGDISTPQTIMASNTSSFSITQLASHYLYPSSFLGVHFMNPPHVNPVVELIKADQTASSVIAYVKSLLNSIQKTVIDVMDSPGFVVNRLMIPLINEAFDLLHFGVADALSIDNAMMGAAKHPLGPLALADMIGLDTCLAIMESLHQQTGDPKYRPSLKLKAYVHAGLLGKKTNQGVYVYEKF